MQLFRINRPGTIFVKHLEYLHISIGSAIRSSTYRIAMLAGLVTVFVVGCYLHRLVNGVTVLLIARHDDQKLVKVDLA
jgi:hypothetical protein